MMQQCCLFFLIVIKSHINQMKYIIDKSLSSKVLMAGNFLSIYL